MSKVQIDTEEVGKKVAEKERRGAYGKIEVRATDNAIQVWADRDYDRAGYFRESHEYLYGLPQNVRNEIAAVMRRELTK